MIVRAGRRWARLFLFSFVVLNVGCATRFFTPPVGPGAPFVDASAVWRDITARCRDARVFVAEIKVDGWVGARRDRFAATFHGAVTRADDLYLEVPGLGPGGPFVKMVGRGEQAVLLLPRDQRVLRAPTRDIVDALTGLRWDAEDLLDVLSGCVATSATDVTGTSYGDRVKFDLGPGAVAWAVRRDGRWRVEAATRDGLLLEYQVQIGPFPADVRVSSKAADVTPLLLTFRLAQVSANIDLEPGTFVLSVPAGFAPMTLDDLRVARPLGEGK